MSVVLFLMLVGFPSNALLEEVGLFTKALWFLQAFGNPSCSRCENDQQVKIALAKALAKDREITFEEIDGLMKADSFAKFAGPDQRLSESELDRALDSDVPSSRMRLTPELRQHAELLTTSFDMIEPNHHESIDKLAEWIATQWQPNSSLHVIAACTGNSRRSILSAAMGNMAAAYYGFDNIRFHSGGTAPSAFNKRTIAALKEIGFQIEATGQEAERGDAKTPNPTYHMTWGKDLEATEFSKHFQDTSNPQSGFAVILVCSDADAECPIVPGASLRVSMTFIDPKVYDDGIFEAKKYAERRDDIGRTFLAVMANARRRMDTHQN
jgi:arsenate reductase (thioredoxin)